MYLPNPILKSGLIMWTTFDVEKIFQIKRTSLYEWIDPKYDYISPSERADGKGTKTLFSLEDLYRIALFINLLRLGSTRLEAADYIKTVDWGKIGDGKNQLRFAYKRQEMVSGKIKGKGTWKTDRELPELIKGDYVFFLLVNLVGIKQQVEMLISE